MAGTFIPYSRPVFRFKETLVDPQDTDRKCPIGGGRTTSAEDDHDLAKEMAAA
jgi:hypothetical protein